MRASRSEHERSQALGAENDMSKRQCYRAAGSWACVAALAIAVPGSALAQARHPTPGQPGTANVHMVAHIPLGGYLHVADIDIEQELSRPYAYVSRAIYQPTGLSLIHI